MKPIIVESHPDKYLISVDRDMVSEDFINDLVQKIKIEHLAQKIDFDESIEELSDEIKETWWKKNKDRFLKFERGE